MRSMPANSHDIDYEIVGADLQFVEIQLDPNETVIGEAGALMFLEEGINFDTHLGDGSSTRRGVFSKTIDIGKRMMGGESLFLTHFTNRGLGRARVGFASPYPGQIVPVDLAEMGGEIITQRDAFLCAAHGTHVGVAFNKRLGATMFGGEGFVLQRLRGDGMAFVHAGGSIRKTFLDGKTLRLDTGCLVAFQPSLTYSIERAGNLKSMVFGGEGLFLATMSGTGWVWSQSLPFHRLASRVANEVAPPPN